MSHPVAEKLAILLRREEEETAASGSAPKSRKATMPTAAFVRRHARLLRMAKILDADASTEPDIIAQELGIGRRTLYRDMELLRRAGVNLKFCRMERRYRLDSLYMRIALGLSKSEATAFLEWSTRWVEGAAVGGAEIVDPLDRAFEKIARILFSELHGVRHDKDDAS